MPCNYNNYPPNWHSEIRPRILERDGHKCKWCKVPNYEFIYRDKNGDWHIAPEGHAADEIEEKIIKIILTVAHLDHDEHNWEVKDDRLAALCQKCHLNYDKLEKARRRKLRLEDSRDKYQIEKYKESLFPIQDA